MPILGPLAAPMYAYTNHLRKLLLGRRSPQSLSIYQVGYVAALHLPVHRIFVIVLYLYWIVHWTPTAILHQTSSYHPADVVDKDLYRSSPCRLPPAFLCRRGATRWSPGRIARGHFRAWTGWPPLVRAQWNRSKGGRARQWWYHSLAGCHRN